MCGINGFNFCDSKLINKMNDCIAHRGPDAEGTFCNKNVSLGHRRLAILDLSEKGKQPMFYEHNNKKVAIVFNGEIYNFQEIKDELILKGYKFNSTSDTEVMLASYLEYGEDCVKKFNGMWAFCIYDFKKQLLFLSRDRVGKKPLHYFFDGKKFIFSSEIKGLLVHKIDKTFSKDAVDLYFSLGFIPAPKTIYSKIEKLEARQNLVFDLKEKKMKKYYYYDWPDYTPINDEKKLISECKKLLEDSVKKRLISDVPLGAFLSGGLDSSAVVAEMTKLVDKEKLNTYSIGFEGEFDESKYINLVKNKLKTKHHHKYFREEDFRELLKKIFYYYDEPFADPSMFPSFFLSKFTREGLTVALSGDGGDEVFGGYPRYRIASLKERLSKTWLPLKLFNYLPLRKIKYGTKLLSSKNEEFYEARTDFYRPEIVNKLLKETLVRCLKKTNNNLQEAVRLMDIYLYTLPENFLQKVDRASMANALEVRCPLLDYRLIEYSMKIPSKWKCNFFKDKILFRKILSKYLPKEIVKRKKRGFTPPINKWITQEKYISEMKIALKELDSENVISKEWISFYREKIMKEDNLVANNYKIRLFLFFRWWKYWKNFK